MDIILMFFIGPLLVVLLFFFYYIIDTQREEESLKSYNTEYRLEREKKPYFSDIFDKKANRTLEEEKYKKHHQKSAFQRLKDRYIRWTEREWLR